MMSKGLKLAEPPPRRVAEVVTPEPTVPRVEKLAQVREGDRVQFNKKVSRRVADGYEMLAIRARRKVPDLLAEALEMLEERYGKV